MRQNRNVVGIMIMVFFLSVFSAQGRASDRVILSVSGAITKGGEVHRVDFTLAELKALPQYVFKTKNPWVSEPHKYRGPRLSAILKKVGAGSDRLTLIALNDYQIDLNFKKIQKYHPILAWSDNGKIMSVRDRGPLWLMLPVFRYPELKDNQYNSYMVWQLRRIIVHH
ncbi:MAG: hypothetical protein CENE_00689 [Candidatus Celerinatantimonas neptuna]|nr:MAG: hypothetical protein CENE_00689 [Candidatus Celerinatantimonas neptuna]